MQINDAALAATEADSIHHDDGQLDWLTEWMRAGGVAVDGKDAFLEYVAERQVAQAEDA